MTTRHRLAARAWAVAFTSFLVVASLAGAAVLFDVGSAWASGTVCTVSGVTWGTVSGTVSCTGVVSGVAELDMAVVVPSQSSGTETVLYCSSPAAGSWETGVGGSGGCALAAGGWSVTYGSASYPEPGTVGNYMTAGGYDAGYFNGGDGTVTDSDLSPPTTTTTTAATTTTIVATTTTTAPATTTTTASSTTTTTSGVTSSAAIPPDALSGPSGFWFLLLIGSVGGLFTGMALIGRRGA